MRKRRSLALFLCSMPFMLMQLNLTSCLPGVTGNNGGTASPAFNISPTVIISADVQRGIAPLRVRFSSAASTDDGLIVDRFWNFGDNQTSREISPTHRYETTGDFTVTLTLTDDQGATNSKSIVISVTEAPVAVIKVNHTSAETSPATFNFDGSQSHDPDGTITSYQWDFGDGSREVLPVVLHTFSSPGTFRVRLTVSDNTGVTATDDQIIEVGIPRPSIAFRTPASSVKNLVVAAGSPLFASVTFSVDMTAPHFLRAGLDGDRDICDGQAVIYDAATGDEVKRLVGHGDRVNTAVFSATGDDILTASEDKTARLYSADSGDQIRSYANNAAAVSSAALSPDGTRFVQGTRDGGVLVRSIASGNILVSFAGHESAVNAVAYSADGKYVASASDDGTAVVWDARTGDLVSTLTGHAFAVTSVAFSPANSDRVVTGSVDQTAKIWDASSGVELETLDAHTNSVSGVDVSRDGTRIVTASDDRSAIVWDFSGRVVRRFTGHTDRVRAATFSPDGRRIATGSSDNTAIIWDVATGDQIFELEPCVSPINDVSFSPDGKQLLVAVAARNDIRLETNPSNGNDINLTVPTEFSLSDVTPGQYFLWAEVDTDRTSPVRTYSRTVVNVTAPFTGTVDSFTPRVPLVNEEATIVFDNVRQRQIVTLGPLSEGDKLEVTLVTSPGYAPTHSDAGYGFLILDSEEKVFATFQKGSSTDPTGNFDGGLLAQNQTLIVGHNSANYYIAMDSGDSVNVKITRGFGINKRAQRVLLDYRGQMALRVARQTPVDVDPFDAAVFNDILNPPPAPPFGEAETTSMKAEIADFVRQKFAAWNVEVFTSDDDELPAPPYISVFFGGASAADFGASDFIDPRNSTLTGVARIATTSIAEAFPASTSTELADLIGIATVHHIGHLLGFRHADELSDVMAKDHLDTTQEFASSPLRGDELYVPVQIGEQDAPTVLDEVVGAAP